MNSLLVAIYNLIFESGVPIKKWQRRLIQYKNIHAGKSCIVIGNGPSVSLDDLAKINELDCIKIVFNRFHKVYQELPFDPDYTLAIDPRFIDDFFDEIIDFHKGELFLGHHMPLERADEYQWFKVKSLEEFVFSDDPIKFTSPGGSVVIAALQLASFMGCRDFYLYGIDHSFKNYSVNSGLAQGDGNHFIDNYRSGKAWYPPETLLIEKAFRESRKVIERNSGSIVNISRKTQLEELPKLGFEEFLLKFQPKR